MDFGVEAVTITFVFEGELNDSDSLTDRLSIPCVMWACTEF